MQEMNTAEELAKAKDENAELKLKALRLEILLLIAESEKDEQTAIQTLEAVKAKLKG